MTIDIQTIQHPNTQEALLLAQDYYDNYFDPQNPLRSFHRYDFSETIEVLTSWGFQGDIFVQSRIKETVIYPVIDDWTDEIAVRAWIFWRNPITGVWHTTLESHLTSVHHWQEAHSHIKEEATDMALKRARIDTYYPATHTADITIYPLPGETMTAVPLAQNIGPELAALLPDCTLAIFYDTEPPTPWITAVLNGVPPPWVTSALVKDGEISEADLAFDPVTQAELQAHAALPNIHHQATTSQRAASTAPLTLTTAYQDMPGCSLVLQPGTYVVIISFTFTGDTPDSSAEGYLNVGGTRKPEWVMYQPSIEYGGVVSVANSYRITLAAQTTVKLQARKITTLGYFLALSPHTTITAIRTAD